MTTIDVRFLNSQDAEKLKQIRVFCVQESPDRFGASLQEEQSRTVASIRSFLSRGLDDYFVVGAFHNNALVAMAGFIREQSEKVHHKGNVWGVYVMPAYRGQGLSRRIMTLLIDQAKTIDGLTTLLSTAVRRPTLRQACTGWHARWRISLPAMLTAPNTSINRWGLFNMVTSLIRCEYRVNPLTRY